MYAVPFPLKKMVRGIVLGKPIWRVTTNLMEFHYVCDGVDLGSYVHNTTVGDPLPLMAEFIGSLIRIDDIPYRVIEVDDDTVILSENRG
jgi:hypothetical protein